LRYSIQQLIAADAAKLAAALTLDAKSARLEAQYLLQRTLQKPRAWLLAHSEQQLTGNQQADYDQMLQRRLAGEPAAYILGEREFFGLKFKVTQATLIPRPETELLVELALERCGRVAAPPPGTHRPLPCGGVPQQGICRVLDLGTGSGAIALSIAHARPDAEVTAVDASMEALVVAEENAQRLSIRNARFVRGHWFDALDGQRFNLIVSNPPYVAVGDPHLQQGGLPFEPQAALVSGEDGLEDVRSIVAGASAHLQPGGWLLLEHGYDQGERVRELLRNAGLAGVFTARDLPGIERVSGGQAGR
jgi:release factor glutamine methyltransferase